MSNQDENLADLILRFQQMVQDRLAGNTNFHAALDARGPILIEGWSSDPISNPPTVYDITRHEALVLIDPIAYYEELQNWQSDCNKALYKTAFECLDTFSQRAVFRDLIEVMRRRRVAPFIGAGVSFSMGFPLWGRAIELLIKHISNGASQAGQRCCAAAQTDLASGNFIAAAEKLYAYDKLQVDQFIANTYAVRADLRLDEITGPLRLLPDFADGCIITTNFDRLIERLYEYSKKPIQGYMHGSQDHHRFTPALIKGDHCILKLHGDADDNQTYIFSRKQYANAYGNPLDMRKPLTRALQQIFISHSLLFIGCSLEQDQTLEVFAKVVAEKQFDLPQHFALLDQPANDKSKRRKQDRLLRLGITPIWYRVKDAGKDHSELETLLRLAVDASEGKVRV